MKMFELRWKYSLIVVTLLLIDSPGPANLTTTSEDPIEPESTTEFGATGTSTGTTPSPFCFGPGRHPNTTDTTCQRYLYCSPNSTGTSYIVYPFICPKNYVFKPITSTCVRPASYPCPITPIS